MPRPPHANRPTTATNAVLLVDGNAPDARALAQALRRARLAATVTVAPTLDAALEALAEGAFSTVIAALDLADAPGIEVVHRLHAATPETPLVALYDTADDTVAWESVTCGAQDLLARGRVEVPALRQALRHARLRTAADQRQRQSAFMDALTGLANEDLYLDRLQMAVARARRHSHAVGLIVLDLDDFAEINARLGRAGGDAVLQQVAKRLREAVRDCDTVARLEEDAFALVLEDLASAQDAALVAQRLLRVLEEDIEVLGRSVNVAASVGVACYPEVAASDEGLRHAADRAMYRAKLRRESSYHVAGSAGTVVRKRPDPSVSWVASVDVTPFEVHYQPLVRVEDGGVVGIEALLRRHQPDGTLIPAAAFLKDMDDNGQIIAVGRWVLDQALRAGKALAESLGRPIRVAVNAAPAQLRSGTLPDDVRLALATVEFAPHLLEIELTEKMFDPDDTRTVRTLDALRLMGVRISVDDFGTGTSAYAYLRRFPIDVVKIDRPVIGAIDTPTGGRRVAKAIIKLAHQLGLEVVAEGVETRSQADFLAKVGCDLAQGYLYAQPQPLSALLQAESAARPASAVV